jgi:dihydroflavonol-4-reductase
MILVTGATGHLGNVLVRELIARGEKVRALVLPGESLLPLEGMLIEVFVGNVLDLQALRLAMKGVDRVFNLAGIIAIRPGMEEVMRQVNVEGARNVAEIALENKVQRLVHVSSVHAFSRQPHGTVMDEKTPLALNGPVGSYDRTKAEGTRAVLDQVERGLNAVIVCPSGIIGSRDYARSEMGRILATFAARKSNFLINGAYDFVDVRDVVSGLILALERGKKGEIYILSGSQATVENLHQMAREAAGKGALKLKVPVSMAMFFVSILQHFFRWLKIKSSFTVYSIQTLIDNSLYSSLKASQELGYRPRPLKEAVVDFLVWHRTQQKAKQESRKAGKTLQTRLKKVNSSRGC